MTLLTFFLGASFGSFFGLLVDRFPHRSIISPGSSCDHCGHRLNYRDLVPILSQILSRSACRYCSAPIPKRYLMIELLCGFLSTAAIWHWISLLDLLILALGILLSLYDLKDKSYPLIAWLVVSLPLVFLSPPTIWTLVFLLLALLAGLGYIPMGAGDFLYMATLSLSLNGLSLLQLLQVSSFLGLLYFFQLSDKKESIPFMPFLTAGFALVLFFNIWL